MAKSINSTFAILDVMRGRVSLARRINFGERIPVTIRGYIDTVHGNDDGTSIEFSLEVTSVVERMK